MVVAELMVLRSLRRLQGKHVHQLSYSYWQRITVTASETFFPPFLYRELQCTLLIHLLQSSMQGDSGGKDSILVGDSIGHCEEKFMWTCV